MDVLVAGSSGFLGSRLVDRLGADGHTVTRLVRRTPAAGEVRWDPYAGPLDPHVVAGRDLVVNLAGTPTIGNPHSSKWARQLRESRVTTTWVLAEAIAASAEPPAFLAGNAVGWYGDHGDQPLTESADSRGHTLMSSVCRDWQDATKPASDAGARVVLLRTAPVLDPRGAPLRQLALLFRLGLGGPLGNGHQYFPVVSTRDWLSAVDHLVTGDLSGPVNLCLPRAPTNAEFTRALAAAVHRPAIFRVPAPVIRLAAGPAAPEVLGSVRTVPQKLLDDGFTFAHPDIEALLAHELV